MKGYGFETVSAGDNLGHVSDSGLPKELATFRKDVYRRFAIYDDRLDINDVKDVGVEV
jgi:hypothetical protein